MSCKVEILGKGKKLSSATDEQKIALAACRKKKKLALKDKLKKGVSKYSKLVSDKVKNIKVPTVVVNGDTIVQPRKNKKQ